MPQKSKKAANALKNIWESDFYMIGITVQKAHGDYDIGTSKLFGAPTCPDEWLENGFIGDDDFFFCQLCIDEFKKYDTEELLPQSGFIYFFLTEKDGAFIPNVKYHPENPQTVIEDFNAGFEAYGDIESDFSIDFTEYSGDGSATLLNDGNEVILFKYDPLDDNMPEFLADTEKTAVFRIGKEALKKLDFSNVTFSIE